MLQAAALHAGKLELAEWKRRAAVNRARVQGAVINRDVAKGDDFDGGVLFGRTDENGRVGYIFGMGRGPWGEV